MNLEPLREVAAQIAADPESFNITTWGCKDEMCNTVACVAGHVMWKYYPEEFKSYVTGKAHYTVDPFHYARAKLELTLDQAVGLFEPDQMGWINDHRHLVPACLIWMADNKRVSWRAAIEGTSS